ncbi:uncharacterized protein PV06_03284 [Exophiala oligosperma]|uniref:Uncharacterized protein n=1 Tax=Exophiala oligosperma TaxID=215243 RepID=A0A0D2AYE6_9EURO|nr:uncharacterized protein PV06_03284 [Exophiala oligosperma]KIW44841.1 hypothetical protein PV06_03284 [Exophiala oligosperma]
MPRSSGQRPFSLDSDPMENNLDSLDGAANWARRSSSPMCVDQTTLLLLFCLAQSICLRRSDAPQPYRWATSDQIFPTAKVKPTKTSDASMMRTMIVPTNAWGGRSRVFRCCSSGVESPTVMSWASTSIDGIGAMFD